MSFLANLSAGCLPHGGIGTSADVCCSALKAWTYDANTGIPYNGIGCWNALCASVGQWAGPGGVGNSCCSPLVNVAGKCAMPTSNLPAPSGSSDYTMPILFGGVALIAVMMMKKKGKGSSVPS